MAENEVNGGCPSEDGCAACGESGCSARKEPQDLKIEQNMFSDIKKVIAVISGKGGVGKSLTAALLASAVKRRGKNVALLDADITGPSIPHMFGKTGMAQANDMGIFPVESETGIELMSVNFLLEDETTPVIWRGPVISSVVEQFWRDVLWGETDYMFVDMPPGTGDVPLTVMQSLPVDGVIAVTSPQELVSVIVEKAANMADMMNVPVLGIVENMSYYKCPDCGEKHSVFGESHIDEIAEKHNIKTVAKLPIDPEYARAADTGRIEEINAPELDAIVDMLETI